MACAYAAAPVGIADGLARHHDPPRSTPGGASDPFSLLGLAVLVTALWGLVATWGAALTFEVLAAALLLGSLLLVTCGDRAGLGSAAALRDWVVPRLRAQPTAVLGAATCGAGAANTQLIPMMFHRLTNIESLVTTY